MKEPTETDFTHSVDREIIRQIGDLNFRGLSLIRKNLLSDDPALSLLACTDREVWRPLDESALKQVAEAPYVLFELPFDPATPGDGSSHDIWSTPSGRDYVRLLCHFAWQVCRPCCCCDFVARADAGCRAEAACRALARSRSAGRSQQRELEIALERRPVVLGPSARGRERC